jgi:hypothetical protein
MSIACPPVAPSPARAHVRRRAEDHPDPVIIAGVVIVGDA